MWSPAIAEQLRRRGRDAIAALQRDDLRGLSDEALLEHATAEHRVLVTRDVGDFSELALRLRADDRDHHGIILVPPHRFSASRAGSGALVVALDAVLKGRPGDRDLVNEVLWLESE